MRTIKVQAIKTFESLKDIFQKGDVLTLNVETHSKDTIIHNSIYGINHSVFGVVFLTSKQVGNANRSDILKFSEPFITTKGSYKGYTITTSDGRTYDESIIGLMPLDLMFKKI